MDYKELLKKYWFVGFIGICLIVFIGVYAVDSYNNRELTVSSKQIDGKYAVYSVDGDYIFADDFYDSLFAQNGLNCEYITLQRAILQKSYETTEEMNNISASNATYVYQQYGEESIVEQLQQMGYIDGTDDLIEYYNDMQKRDLLISDYLKSHTEEIPENFIEDNKARLIYHILITVEDITSETDDSGNTIYTANPTDKESEKLNKVLEELKTKSFEEVAMQYSDDTGSAVKGGLIGCVSNQNSSNYVKIFSDTALALEDDAVSEVVTSEYGYHIIWNAGSSLETLINDSAFTSQVINSDSKISFKAILNKAEELNFEIVDEKLKEFLNLQIQDVTVENTSTEETTDSESGETE